MGPKFEYVYFDAQARGESIRLAFAAAGEEYTDTRVAYDKWTQVQKDAPQGRLPYIISPNGKKTSQSLAILNYLRQKFGLRGKDAEENLDIDEVVQTCADLLTGWENSLMKGPDHADVKNFKNDDVPKYFKMLEDLVKSNGKSGFAVGSKLTIADLMLYNSVQLGGLETLGKYPCLQANRKKVEENANLAKYLKSRPKEIY